MEKLESHQSKRYMLQVPVNYPKETLSESHLLNVRKALQIILENNPEVLIANSPEEALQKLGFHFPEQKGKWAAAAERLSTQNTLSIEAGKILEEEGKNFREGFILGDHFESQEK